MSNPNAKRKRARFIVPSEVEIDEGIVLAPGVYDGRTTHLGFIKHEECVWTLKMHFLELDVDQISGMGGRAPEHATLVEYDITKYVEDGAIRIEQTIPS